MKTIFAYGDSNTWGLIPGTSRRYPWGERWTSLLQEKAGSRARVIEEGLCGRTTIFEDELRPARRGLDTLPFLLESHSPLDAAILMLGTNDCKAVYHAPAPVIAKGIELCLDELLKELSADKILLISPIELGQNVWRPDKDPEFDRDSVETSRLLKAEYQRVAKERGTAFLAASDLASPSEIDEEHLTAEGHKALAEAVYDKLKEMSVL